MTSRIAQWTLDVQDVGRMAEFWSEVLGYGSSGSRTGPCIWCRRAGGEPTVWLQPSAGPKPGKNRDHPDLRRRTSGAAEVRAGGQARARRGSTSGRPGRSRSSCSPIPEGNEFCILR